MRLRPAQAESGLPEMPEESRPRQREPPMQPECSRVAAAEAPGAEQPLALFQLDARQAGEAPRRPDDLESSRR